jgi:hypothetical protein
VARKEDVLKAVGNAATKLRRKLGESLSTVERFDTPLEVTTSSLEALQAHDLGIKTLGQATTPKRFSCFNGRSGSTPNSPLPTTTSRPRLRDAGEMAKSRAAYAISLPGGRMQTGAFPALLRPMLNIRACDSRNAQRHRSGRKRHSKRGALRSVGKASNEGHGFSRAVDVRRTSDMPRVDLE